MTQNRPLVPALLALRASPAPASRQVEWAWSLVSEALGRYALGVGPMHRDDIRQRGLLKVLKHVHAFAGDQEASAQSWLRQIYRSAVSDYFRLQGQRALENALGREDLDPFESIAAPDPTAWADPDKLEVLLDRILDRVHHWLADRPISATKRAGDTRRAQVALMANVCGLGLDGIRDEVGLGPDTPSNAALSKWIERGRESVLIPAIDGWDDPITEPLMEILREARRGDAGRPRPGRRAAVSGSKDDPSSSVDDDL